ncbi:MAG TPA: phenylalanine--tRNA ligase subunit alpha [Patescibacteria group bacterium]|nr:phenylalanine--tRNA ligase subunit alpha [Patescibacteria group bacterium]
MKTLEEIRKQFAQDSNAVKTVEQVQELRVRYVGRKSGALNEILRSLKSLSEEEKHSVGASANVLRKEIEQKLDELQKTMNGEAQQGVIEDLTLPGVAPQVGHLHPLTLVTNELMDIFASMGFMIYEGPELENDFYNFESLNFADDHPARDIQDTFVIKTPITRKEKRTFGSKNPWLMRAHTSNMQVRIMEQFQPPLRCVVPGRVFRNEATDASHEHTFYQLEGFVVDKNITIGHAMWTLKEILRQIFKKDVRIRLRPGFFPFVEPGYELDCSCLICNGIGCPTCKRSGWVELVPCGMIHPKVFEAAGYAHGAYTGFAFGLGLSRLTMMKYGIKDIRMFTSNDRLAFLEQF